MSLSNDNSTSENNPEIGGIVGIGSVVVSFCEIKVSKMRRNQRGKWYTLDEHAVV